MCGSGGGGGGGGGRRGPRMNTTYFKTPFSEKFPNEAIFGAFLKNI